MFGETNLSENVGNHNKGSSGYTEGKYPKDTLKALFCTLHIEIKPKC